MNDPINRIFLEGDMVDVYFDTVECEFGVKVLYTPVATGDSFHLERQDGTLLYVQSFTKMVRKEAK